MKSQRKDFGGLHCSQTFCFLNTRVSLLNYFLMLPAPFNIFTELVIDKRVSALCLCTYWPLLWKRLWTYLVIISTLSLYGFSLSVGGLSLSFSWKLDRQRCGRLGKNWFRKIDFSKNWFPKNCVFKNCFSKKCFCEKLFL